jgi:putative ABC transport system permease protein
MGVGLSLAAARAVSSFLYGVTATDPGVFLTAAVVLVLVAAAAAFLPARRAVRMNPVMALRLE